MTPPDGIDEAATSTAAEHPLSQPGSGACFKGASVAVRTYPLNG
ncbi:hypothetical protein [Nostocoides sp. HKS02]|nr:hypothetical protein [Tetrasphaera sp. HKS02]